MINSSRLSDSPIRVSFFTPLFKSGGIEEWILTLATNFQAVKPCTLVVGDEYTEQSLCVARRLFERVIVLKDKCPKSTKKVQKAVSRDHAIITWASSPLPGLDLPVFQVSHNASDKYHITPDVSNFLVAVSNTAKRPFPEHLQSDVDVIYNGIRLDRVAPRFGRSVTRKLWGVSDDKKVALFLGRFHHVKNPIKIVQAIAALPDDYQAVFVGTGEEEAAIAMHAQTLAPGRVSIVEPQNHIGDVLAASDCLVLPSDSEGFGLVMVEAWAARLPVVVSDIPVVRELHARHPTTHLAVVMDDLEIETISKGIVKATDGESLDVDAIRDIAFDYYSASRMAADWEQLIYRRLFTYYGSRVYPQPKVIKS